MSLSHNPKIVTSGLVFTYDMNNIKKSWKGAPTTNLAKTSSGNIDWSLGNLNQIVLRSVITTNEKYLITSTSSTGTAFRMYFNPANLVNGSTYTLSYRYKILSGGPTFIANDWCDTSIVRNTVSLGNGIFYETSTGTRATYDGTFRFMDFEISNNTQVEIWDLQLEQRSFATPYINSSSSRERSNTQAILDLTGRNTITANSLTYNADGSFSFNGSSNYVSISDSPSLQVADTFSISAWIYPTILNSRFGVFSTRTANDTGSWQLEVGAGSNGQNRVVVTGIETWIFESSNNVISTNQWCNVCFVKPNNATQGGIMYVNGVQITPATTTAYTILNNANNKTIGVGTSLLQNFPGNIGNIQLHNRALTAAEVLQNYSAFKGRFGL